MPTHDSFRPDDGYGVKNARTAAIEPDEQGTINPTQMKPKPSYSEERNTKTATVTATPTPTPKPAPIATPMPMLATAAPTPAPSTTPTNTLNGKAATPQREIFVPWLRFFPLTVIVPDTGLTRQYQSIRLFPSSPGGMQLEGARCHRAMCFAETQSPASPAAARAPQSGHAAAPPKSAINSRRLIIEEFSSRVGLPSCFGLETSILARGHAGSNRAVLTTAGWPAHGTKLPIRNVRNPVANGGKADSICSQ